MIVLTAFQSTILRSYYYSCYFCSIPSSESDDDEESADTRDVRMQILLDNLHHAFPGEIFLLSELDFDSYIAANVFSAISKQVFEDQIEITATILREFRREDSLICSLITKLADFVALKQKSLDMNAYYLEFKSKIDLEEWPKELTDEDDFTFHFIFINCALRTKRKLRIKWDKGTYISTNIFHFLMILRYFKLTKYRIGGSAECNYE